ncbi:MAG TPA: insulinase family protein, partial [Planctomycetota bacterium]|nr:insulinase family protein [Planctomycetota bacterium]
MSQWKRTPVESAGAVVHDTRLDNGLRVLVVERHTDPVVASMCWYRVGSKSEHPDEAGMSHFLEHMMFKGTPTFGKGSVDREITRLGGSNNAFTSYDYTAYWFELASDRWETALDL